MTRGDRSPRRRTCGRCVDEHDMVENDALLGVPSLCR